VVQEWVAKKTVGEVVTMLTAAKVPCGAANDVPAVFSDPQVQAREMIVPVTHPTIGGLPVLGQLIKFSRTPTRAGDGLAEPGQHNGDVYGKLLSANPTQLATWASTGVT
jgi:crotonobetainyl-CoA:carnitine CoA-transferase CaiB-like acyl-CoA transferase